MEPITVWLVDGNFIRTNIFPDYVEGGHWLVYDFVPENEIWLDDELDPEERPFILFHELYEINLMLDGMKYDQAHAQASLHEWEIRQHPERLADFGLAALTPLESIYASGEATSLRTTIPNFDETDAGDAFAAIVDDNKADHERLKKLFLLEMRRRLVAILFAIDGGNVGIDEDTELIDAAMSEQAAYLDGFIADLDNLSEAQIAARAKSYAQSLAGYATLWSIKQAGDTKLKWKYNPEAEHCEDCLALNGEIRPASTWAKLNLYPRSGNTKCLFNCKCELVEVRSA